MIKSTTNIKEQTDSILARCTGLVAGIARRKADNKRVEAEFITKADGPFFCQSCLSEAIVRKCVEKVDHFAHHARLSPVVGRKDHQLHNNCRDEICSILQSTFPDGKWDTERSIPAKPDKNLKEIIPDISGRINNQPIAIEVQTSSYTINKLVEKTIEYHRRKVAVLWLVPLKSELGSEPFRPRLFEKYLHSLYFGRIYYWIPDSNKFLLPVHFSPTKRWIEEATWFDTDDHEEKTVGGYYLTYRTVKMPNYAQKVDLTNDFNIVERPAFEPKNVKKGIPVCTIFKDKLKEWWDKGEFKDIQKQHIAVRGSSNIEIEEQYDYFDDYDDFDSSESI